MYDPDGRDYSQWADRKAQEAPVETGFGENFQAGLAQAIDEEWSISSMFNPGGEETFKRSAITARNNEIKKLFDDGDLEGSLKEQFTVQRPRAGQQVQWDKLAQHLNETGDYDFKTLESINEANKAELDNRRKYAANISAGATGMGKVGSFVGMAVGGSLDPINVATMGLALPGATLRTSRALYIANSAGRVALTNMATQAVIEPMVHAWKEDIGAEYTWKDSALNMTAAGVFGGLVGGAASSINIGGRIAINKAIKDFERIKSKYREMGFEEDTAVTLAMHDTQARNAPDPEMPTEEHFKNIHDADQAIQNPVREVPSQENIASQTPEMEAQMEAELDLAFDNMPDNMHFDMDDSMVSLKEDYKKLMSEEEKALKAFEDFQTCRRGG
jgi:hypothetical protein